MEKITLTVQQRQLDGSLLCVQVEGKVIVQKGTDKEIAGILFEAELNGNAGKSRVHIFAY